MLIPGRKQPIFTYTGTTMLKHNDVCSRSLYWKLLLDDDWSARQGIHRPKLSGKEINSPSSAVEWFTAMILFQG